MSVCDLRLPIWAGSKHPSVLLPAKQIFTDSDGVVFFKISEEPSADDDNETLYFPYSGHLRESDGRIIWFALGASSIESHRRVDISTKTY